MQKNNLIDQKKIQAEQQNKMVKNAESPAKADFFNFKKKKIMFQELALPVKAKAKAKEKISEEKISISGNPPFLGINTFWLKLGKFFLYSLIFLLPLFFLPTTINPIDANKHFLAVFLVSASLFCFSANSYFVRRIVYSKSALVFAAVFFVIAGGISAFFSISPNNSLYGDFTQADVFADFIIYGLTLYLTAVYFKKEDFGRAGIAFLASIVLASFLGLLQLFGFYIFPFDFAKSAGFNPYGSVINFDIFMAFGLALIVAALTELNISLKIKTGLFFAGLLIALNLILINYQPIWILLAVTMVFYAICKFIFKPASESGIFPDVSSSAPLAAGIIAFFFVLISPSLPKIINMPDLPIDVKPNFSATMNISKNALRGYRIFTGMGLATFSSQYNAYRPAESNQSDFWRIKFNQGFSFISTYLATAGAIGILSILFIIFVFARLAAKNIEDKKTIVVSVGVFFMILSWFFYPAYFVGLVFSFIALGMLAVLGSCTEEFDFSRASKSRAAIGLALIIIFTAGAIFALYFSGKKYAAAFYFQKGLREYSAIKTTESAENILRAISLDQKNDQYLRSASQLLLIGSENSRDSNIEINKDAKFQEKIASSVSLAKSAAEINPADSENWYNLGDIYEKIINIAAGADSFAESSYLKATELDPKNPDSLIGRARVLMSAARQTQDDKIKEEKIKTAIDILEKAIGLKSNYAASHFQLGLAYMLSERKDDAIKEFELAKTLTDSIAPINFQLGLLYYNSNNFDKAKNEMENAILLVPNFSNAKYVLGLIYDKKGDENSAISQFEAVLKLNPNSAEVKTILNNLKTKGSAFMSEKPVSSETIDNSLGLPAIEPNQNIGAGLDISTGEKPIISPKPSLKPSPIPSSMR